MQTINIDINYTDLRAAIRHDYNIATKEGFPQVAERALNILNQMEAAAGSLHGDLKVTIVVEGVEV